MNKPMYQLQGNNRIPMYFDRNWGIKCQNPVVATGEYLGENHKFHDLLGFFGGFICVELDVVQTSCTCKIRPSYQYFKCFLKVIENSD